MTIETLDELIRQKARDELTSKVHLLFMPIHHTASKETLNSSVLYSRFESNKPTLVTVSKLLNYLEDMIIQGLVSSTEQRAVGKFIRDHEKFIEELEHLQNQVQ
jgi:hypothetical protein